MQYQYLKTETGVEKTYFNDEAMAAFAAQPVESRPVFLPETDPLVVALLAAQAEAAKPQEVTMRQARLALLEAGMLPNVETAIANMPGGAGAAARIEWEYSSVLKRSQPLVAAMAGVLNITAAQMDAIFLSASLK